MLFVVISLCCLSVWHCMAVFPFMCQGGKVSLCSHMSIWAFCDIRTSLANHWVVWKTCSAYPYLGDILCPVFKVMLFHAEYLCLKLCLEGNFKAAKSCWISIPFMYLTCGTGPVLFIMLIMFNIRKSSQESCQLFFLTSYIHPPCSFFFLYSDLGLSAHAW